MGMLCHSTYLVDQLHSATIVASDLMSLRLHSGTHHYAVLGSSNLRATQWTAPLCGLEYNVSDVICITLHTVSISQSVIVCVISISQVLYINYMVCAAYVVIWMHDTQGRIVVQPTMWPSGSSGHFVHPALSGLFGHWIHLTQGRHSGAAHYAALGKSEPRAAQCCKRLCGLDLMQSRERYVIILHILAAQHYVNKIRSYFTASANIELIGEVVLCNSFQYNNQACTATCTRDMA